MNNQNIAFCGLRYGKTKVQAYKDKEDRLREYIKDCDYIDRECENERVLQILNEGDK